LAYQIRKVTGGKTESREVAAAALRIGRGTENALQFSDPLIGLSHAVIEEIDGGGHRLRDLGSAGGTFVNGARVSTQTLADGDRIQIGSYLFYFNPPAPFNPPTPLVRGEVRNASAPLVGVLAILEYEEAAAQTATARPIKPVDYARAYGVKRWFFNKTVLSLLLLAGLSGFWWQRWVDVGEGAVLPGRVAEEHRLFESKCRFCHIPWTRMSFAELKTSWLRPAQPTDRISPKQVDAVRDRACAKCHGGPVHDTNEQFTPPCAACHRQHADTDTLAHGLDEGCPLCHADLKVKTGSPKYAIKIPDFEKHPEFSVLIRSGTQPKTTRVSLEDKARLIDTAQVKLNHQKHLAPRLRGPSGPVQMKCKDCHIPDERGQRMAPVTYENHCRECHDLDVNAYIPGERVPHAEPKEIRRYLQVAVSRSRVAAPPPVADFGRGTGRLPSAVAPSYTRQPPASRDPQVQGRIRAMERYVYGNLCVKCHDVDQQGPRIAPTAIPAAWLPQARFTHATHQQSECTVCHKGIGVSSKTTDVTLPKIEVCRECHTPKRAAVTCTLCHAYHNPPRKRGPYPDLLILKLETTTVPPSFMGTQ